MKPRSASPVPLRRRGVAGGRALATALALLLAMTLGTARGAQAAPGLPTHSGGGTIAVEAAHPAGQAIHYIVRVTWDNDGHAADGATVTATPLAADGTSHTPVTLTGSGDGRYEGQVDFPAAGDWTVRFTSIDPTGSFDHAQVVQAPTTTTAPEDEAPTTTGGGFAPADDGTGAGEEEPAGDAATAAGENASDDGDDGGIPILLVVGAAVVAIGGAVTALLAVRRYRSDLAENTGDAASGDKAPADAGASGNSDSSGGGGPRADDAR